MDLDVGKCARRLGVRLGKGSGLLDLEMWVRLCLTLLIRNVSYLDLGSITENGEEFVVKRSPILRIPYATSGTWEIIRELVRCWSEI